MDGSSNTVVNTGVSRALDRLVESGELSVVVLDANLVAIEKRGVLTEAVPLGIPIDEGLTYLAGLAPDLLNLQDEPDAAFLLANVGITGATKVNIEAFWQAEERRYCLLVHRLGLRTAPEAEIVKQIKYRRIVEQHLQQARQALAMQAALIESIAECAPVALAVVDSQLVYAFATRAWHDLFSLGPEALTGRSLTEAPSRMACLAREDLDSALAGRSVLCRDATIESAGASRRIRYCIAPWHRSGGAAQGLLMVAIELTELLEQVKSLEHDVARLQAANRALDDFVAIAAHDLEAPRRAIDRALATQDAEMLAEIAGHTARLGDLLRDLLAYAQLAGERAAPEMVDIGAVAHSALSLAEHSHQFKLLSRPDVMRIVTDRVLLETIVRNLVTNAVRHHDAKSGMIEVRLDDQGHAWRLSVADDGPGIAARDRLQVFEPFRQIDARSTSGGAGLGLFLVATAARRLGGEVTIEERPDDRRGAVFAVVWPKSPKAS